MKNVELNCLSLCLDAFVDIKIMSISIFQILVKVKKLARLRFPVHSLYEENFFLSNFYHESDIFTGDIFTVLLNFQMSFFIFFYYYSNNTSINIIHL